jgi:hypothetical protein
VFGGVFHLGRLLKVKLIDLGNGVYVPKLGDSIGFLASQLGTGGKFDAFDLPTLANGLGWKINPGNVTNFLNVVLSGDYNSDQVVDASDYIVWRNGLDTIYSRNDYNDWRANFGATAQSAATAGQRFAVANLPSSANLAVPEPGTLLTILIVAANLPPFWQKIPPRRRPLRSCAQPRTPCSH